jgi:hypothetical protein
VLLSSLPRAEPSRLAWLKRNPIAVAAGRINQNFSDKIPEPVALWSLFRRTHNIMFVPKRNQRTVRVSPRTLGRLTCFVLACYAARPQVDEQHGSSVFVSQVCEVTLRVAIIRVVSGFTAIMVVSLGWMDILIVAANAALDVQRTGEIAPPQGREAAQRGGVYDHSATVSCAVIATNGAYARRGSVPHCAEITSPHMCGSQGDASQGMCRMAAD